MSALRAFPSPAAASLPWSTIVIVSISDGEFRNRTRSGFLTKLREQFSAVATQRNRMFWSNSLGKTKRSRRQTPYC